MNVTAKQFVVRRSQKSAGCVELVLKAGADVNKDIQSLRTNFENKLTISY